MGICPLAAQLQQQLVDELARQRPGDPLEPVLVVVPSWPAAVQLRRRLAAACEGAAYAGVRFTTPAGLVHALAAAEAADRGLRVLPPWGFELLVWRGAEAHGPYFSGVLQRPGVTAALAGTMRRLRRLEVTAARLDALAGEAREPAERERWNSLAAMGRALEQRLPLARPGPGFADEAALLALAAESLGAAGAPLGSGGPGRGGGYAAGGLPARTGGAGRSGPGVAERLGARRLALWGVDDAFDGAPAWKRLLDALARAEGIEVLRVPGPGTPFVPWPQPGPVRVRTISCATELEEADAIAEQVLEAAQAGVPFWRMAVVYRRDGPQLGWVGDALRRAGVPVFVPGGDSAALTPAGRAVLGWLGLVRDGLRRVPLMDWLRQAPLRPDWLGIEAAEWRPVHWERLSVRAGLAGDPRAWPDRLERLPASEGEAGQRGSDRKPAASLRQAVQTVLGEVEAFPRQGTWGAMAAALCGWFDRAVDGGAPGAATVRARLAGLARLDEVDVPGASVSIQLFAEAAAGVLDAPAVDGEGPGFEQGAVALLSAPQAMGCAFDAVVVGGLVQPGFPAGPAVDPVLSPQDLERLGDIGVVQQAVRHSRREEELFAWAASSARQRTVLTRARFEGASGRELLASPFLERLERAGLVDESKRLPPLFVAGRDAGVGLESLPAIHDFDMAAARRLGPEAPDELQRWYPHGAQGARARQARWDTAPTVYDGVLDALAEAHPPGRATGADEPGWSPTELEDYARCPRYYFFHRLLGMEAEGEPEEGEGLVGLVRGAVVHRALGRFYEELLGKPGPLPPAGWEARVRRAVQEALEQGEPALSELAGVARVQADALVEVLARFIRDDAARRAREGLVPVQVEKPFGGLALAGADGRQVRFKGRIDRLDVRAEGSQGPPARVRVVDYKSGRPKDGTATRLNGGLRLQPAVYLWAASRLAGVDVARCSAALAYLDPTAPPRWVELFGSEWAGVEPLLLRVVHTLLAGMQAGYFAADPHPAVRCSGCQFYAICGPEAARQLARKRRPPEGAELARLREEVK